MMVVNMVIMVVDMAVGMITIVDAVDVAAVAMLGMACLARESEHRPRLLSKRRALGDAQHKRAT